MLWTLSCEIQKFRGSGINGYSSLYMYNSSNTLNIFIYRKREGIPSLRVNFDVCTTLTKTLVPLRHSWFFMASFLYAFFSIWNGDLSSKMQNLMFACCSKDEISKTKKWKINFIKNDLQLTSLFWKWIPDACMFSFLVLQTSKKEIFPLTNTCMNIPGPFHEFIDPTSYIIKITFLLNVQFNLC